MITNEVIIDSIATGQNIKKLMKLHNHSVAHLSKLSGLSPTTITNYRSGYNVPNLHNRKCQVFLQHFFKKKFLTLFTCYSLFIMT